METIREYKQSRCRREKYNVCVSYLQYENGIAEFEVQSRLCIPPILREDDKVYSLWVYSFTVGDTVVEDMLFIGTFGTDDEIKTHICIDCSKALDTVKSGIVKITLDIGFEVDDVTDSKDRLCFTVDLEQPSCERFRLLFSLLDHRKKSYKNIYALAGLIGQTYSYSATLANEMWQTLWNENRQLKGMQRRYFILEIFRNLELSITDSVDLLLMDETRVPLILVEDNGTQQVISDLLYYCLCHQEYEKIAYYFQMYCSSNNYHVTNLFSDSIVVSSIWKAISDLSSEHGKSISLKLAPLYKYIECNYPESVFRYLLLAVLVDDLLVKIDDPIVIQRCINASQNYSAIILIGILFRCEEILESSYVDSVLRYIISKYDRLFIDDFSILAEKQDWFLTKTKSSNVFIGFFERKCCGFSQRDTDNLLNIVRLKDWKLLCVCIESVV